MTVHLQPPMEFAFRRHDPTPIGVRRSPPNGTSLKCSLERPAVDLISNRHLGREGDARTWKGLEMSEAPIRFDSDANLLCPLCGGLYTHVDDVHIGGRPVEDGEWHNVHVDSQGRVREHLYEGEMATPPSFSPRRHYISLLGNCEECTGRFAIHFCQHKGFTITSVSRPAWVRA